MLLAHDRPGGMFGAPADPELSAQGRVIVEEFQSRYSQEAPERGAFCVNSGMPESMFGIAGYPLDIIQTENRITVTDPVMYDTPQSVTVWMQRVPDSQLLEYNCVEYNWRNALEEYETD